MRSAAAAPVAIPRLNVRLPRRRFVVAALVAAALTALYVAWFRDSSFASVQHVEVSGLATPEAGAIKAKLEAAAARMTTLDVDEGALRAAVGPMPLVRSLSASGDFPHTLKISVVLNLPVARLVSGRGTVAVARDGTLLPGLRFGSLPTVATRSLGRGRMLRDKPALALIAVAAAAPAPLRARLATVATERGKGIVARFTAGPLVVLGDPGELAAKWAAAAAVLAQASSQGATYVDVRRPRRPIAGGLTLPDAPLSTAAPNPSDLAAPGTIEATGSGGSTIPQAPAVTAGPPTSHTTPLYNSRP